MIDTTTITPKEIQMLIKHLHNRGMLNKRENPGIFDEPSYLSACMAALEFLKATTSAPGIWIFGPISGKSAFTEEMK